MTDRDGVRFETMIRYRVRRWHVVCWARRHPQVFGVGPADERGVGGLFSFPKNGSTEGLAETHCACRRRRVIVGPDPYGRDRAAP